MTSKEKKAPKNESSSSLGLTVGVIVVVAAIVGGIFLATEPGEESGQGIRNRPELSELPPPDRDRYNASVPFSFPGAKSVPTKRYNPMDSDFLDNLLTEAKTVVLKNVPVKLNFESSLQVREWKAFKKWNSNYFQNHLPSISFHVPPNPVVRIHQVDDMQPLSMVKSINWTRPWLVSYSLFSLLESLNFFAHRQEEKVSTEIFFQGKKLLYTMLNTKHLPPALLQDIQPSTYLSLPWSPPLEKNMWMGVPTVTTPAHYDMVHNLYTQVMGYKRFILFPPKDIESLYVFPAIHPSSRQTQVNFSNVQMDQFPKFKDVHPIEVILKPGDVLYIPPFHFHHVSAVGDSISLSISTHTESQEAKVRELIISRTESVFGSNRIPQMKLPAKIALTAEYFRHAFDSIEEEKEFFARILRSRWSHLHLDKEVTGLVEYIQQGRDSFSSQEEIEAIDAKVLFEKMKSAGVQLKGSFSEIQPEIRDILLANHVEWTAAFAIGPQYVEPFLRYVCGEEIPKVK